MNIEKQIAEELGIKVTQVEAVVKLIDEGNTIPFIARYRKEAHGSLDDEQLRNLDERLTYLRNLEERKETVLQSIREQEKLTPELEAKIKEAQTLVAVEDYYRPYKQKRRTRAIIAKEKGLEPLAKLIMEQAITEPLENFAKEYISEEKEVKDENEAIQCALDIIAEEVSDNAEYRQYIRDITTKNGKIVSVAKDEKQESVYEMYYEFEEPIEEIAGHRVLALNRGEAEKVLNVKVVAPEERVIRYLLKQTIKVDTDSVDLENEEVDFHEVGNKFTTPYIVNAVEDSYKRLIEPAIEREIRSELTEKAQDAAIKIFGKNLEQLLMQPPISGKVVLGWDPAFRTGCKLAVVDSTGRVMATTVVYPTAPENQIKETKQVLKILVDKYNISLISVGNGTASRESEQVIAEFIKEIDKPVQYVIVNEAGASVYSASKLATEEFPKLNVGERSAASIARRLQDPLAELVKIDPKSIGVGQYQHDMNQKKLTEALTNVVEDCVNKVGVDLNTASVSLLEYISGVNKTIAKNIVAYREKNGKFTSREQLLNVTKLGPKAYEQCAGFMRIQDGENPLDATSVHPESYKATLELLDKIGMTMDDVKKAQSEAGKKNINKIRPNKKKKNDKIVIKNTNTAFGAAMAKAFGEQPVEVDNKEEKDEAPKGKNIFAAKVKNKAKMAEELGIGEITLDDILKELVKPARDPRDEMPKPILRTDVLEMKDLKEGMILKGTVRNVIDFGAFVDIGVHQDGLVHISELSGKRFVNHPLDVVSVGDIVDVKVLSVDLQKKRIQLSMKL
ncbi:MAG: RNA-binding transcriptional accessory protein [Lachnospiraceae bacterium]|nr:RNA-binding transcriptional accessory protein [Lachnospiraceae bacterium]